jgi:hypothetical protein
MSKSDKEKDPSIQEQGGAAVGGIGGALLGGEIGKAVGKSAIPIPFVGEAIGQAVGSIAGGIVGSKVGGAIGESTTKQEVNVTRKDLNSLEAYYASPEYKKDNPDKKPEDIQDRVQGVVSSKAEHIDRVRKNTGDPNLSVAKVNKEQPSAAIILGNEQVKDMSAAKEWQKKVDQEKANTPEQQTSRGMDI